MKTLMARNFGYDISDYDNLNTGTASKCLLAGLQCGYACFSLYLIALRKNLMGIRFVFAINLVVR